jgi:hypothetical protein
MEEKVYIIHNLSEVVRTSPPDLQNQISYTLSYAISFKGKVYINP